ncbi:hypothetical protein Fmac_031288 [Flemingia macrophylla]|uniref:6,7-dimethyl-8-ribityllumazine synthase n=1 Tax=Flemingia macrophylla TaxID=520843 RepID=A0ABD1L1L2_9FABA
MGNSLRCCLACVLPCGALDLIRIVHLNGYVEEITRPITAGEVLKANPNHVLSKPSSQGVVRRILILSPETDLKRGSIYFLIPASSLPEKKRHVPHATATTSDVNNNNNNNNKNKKKSKNSNDLICKKSAHEQCHNGGSVASKVKKASRRDRRSGHGGLWRPRLESISED